MNKEDFEQAIREHQAQWLKLGMRFFGNESDAQDALQETLMKLWVVRNRMHATSDIMALGTRIMKNECVNIHRRRQHTAYGPPPDTPSSAYSPHLRMEDDEHRALLAWAVNNLPLQARCMLRLHLYEDMSLDEIAAATGKSKGAVKTTLTRARQHITQWLRTRT